MPSGFWGAFGEGPGPSLDRFEGPLGGGLEVHVGPFWCWFGMLFASPLSRRCGTPFGRALGPNFQPQMGAKILPERVLKRCPTRNSENAKNAQPSYVFARKLLPTWARNRTQEGPKRDWKTISSARRKTDPKMVRFGPNLAPQVGSKTRQDASKTPSRSG